MTAAAAGYQGHLALNRRIFARDKGWFVIDAKTVAVRRFHALKRFAHHFLRGVDELLHDTSMN